MAFENLLVLGIGFLLTIGIVKASAQMAYKREVRWGEAFMQWLLLLVFAFVVGMVLGILNVGISVSSILGALG
ncbi:MAG: hypothetical protein NT067_03830 [Candidatus Diapherotrites archaeon]|nr:hypothetical protein [Candidatus Diapherotrites archaeon]